MSPIGTEVKPVNTSFPRGWDGRIAYVVSNLGSPPVLTVAVVLLMASTLAGGGAWAWASVYLVLAILTPLFYLVWLVRRGVVTDLDVQRREQRTRPMIVTLLCSALAWLTLRVGMAPALMVVVAGIVWLQMITIFFITLFWKISVHCASAAGVAVLAWLLIGTPLPLLIVPFIAWSRVRLRRHTLTQTIAGSLLGLAFFITALTLFLGG